MCDSARAWRPARPGRAGIVTLVVFGAVVGLTTAADGHGSNTVYPIHEIEDGMLSMLDLHDGSLADWESLFGVPSLTTADFGSLDVGEGAVIGGKDLQVRAYLAWNESLNKVFVGIERIDNHYVPWEAAEGTELWATLTYAKFDGVAFMVDGDHSGGYYNQHLRCNSGLCGDLIRAQVYYAMPEEPYMAMIPGHVGRQWPAAPPYGDVGVEKVQQMRFVTYVDRLGGVELSTTTVTELMVTPFDRMYWDSAEGSREAELGAGDIIGFQLALPDYDFDDGRWTFGTGDDRLVCRGCATVFRGYHTLAGGEGVEAHADGFVHGELRRIGTGVEPDTWARIKASFQ